MVRRDLLILPRDEYYDKQEYIRWRLNHQYRFNDDVCIVGSDEEGNSLEVDDLQEQLSEIIDGSLEVKRLVKALQEDLGDGWIFPGDPYYAWEGLVLPNDCQTLVPMLRSVLEFPVDMNRIEEFLELQANLKACIGVKWRLPLDDTFVTKQDGSFWEIEDLRDTLESLLGLAKKVKQLIAYVRKQLGEDWLFPGDVGYESEPSGEMRHIGVLLQEILEFKNSKPDDE